MVALARIGGIFDHREGYSSDIILNLQDSVADYLKDGLICGKISCMERVATIKKELTSDGSAISLYRP